MKRSSQIARPYVNPRPRNDPNESGRTMIAPSDENRGTLGEPRDPSPRQLAVLQFLRRFISQHGIAPSRAEIANGVGLARPASAEYHLRALAAKNWLELLPNTQRGIRLLHHGAVPLVMPPHRIRSTETLLEAGHVDEQVPEYIANSFNPRPDFFLAATDAIAATGLDIAPTDLLAVSTTATPRDGDLVITRLRGKVTCVRLRASAAPPLGRDPAQVDGVVVGTVTVRPLAREAPTK